MPKNNPIAYVSKTRNLVFVTFKKQENKVTKAVHNILSKLALEKKYKKAIPQHITADELDAINLNIGDTVVLYDSENRQKGYIGVSKEKNKINWLGLFDQVKGCVLENDKTVYFVFRV